MWLELLLGVVLFFAWFYHHVTKQFGEFAKRGMAFAKPSFPFGSSNAKKLFSGQLAFFALEEDLAESEEFKNEKVFGYFMMGQPTVVINDEELAKLVMIKDFDHFDELRDFGYVTNTRENQLFNHMLTSLPGHKWKKIRTMLNPCFTSAKLRGMVPYLDKAARQMVAFLDKQEGQDLDGRDLFGKFTMDALASGGYGLETDSFSDPDNIFRKMALTLAGAPGFASPWDMPRMMFIAIAPAIAKFFKIPMLAKTPANFLAGVIEKVIKQREKTGERRNDIIDLVLDEMKNSSLSEDFSNDEKELILIANALVLFFAGFDSTAIGLSKVALQLIKNPDIQDKVFEEIEDVLGDDDEVTPDVLNQLKYLDQVIYESMRHEAFMTSHERMCTKDYLIPGTNMTIPKGRVVKVYVKNMELDEKNFKNPKNFDPENFAPENDHNKFAFMQFSQGPRKCIGERFAMMSMKMALTRLLRKHRLVACDKTNMGKLELDPNGVFVIKGGIWLRTEKRT